MSKHNIVVPDHFKVGGREPQGQDVAHEVQKQQFAQAKKQEQRNKPKKKTKA